MNNPARQSKALTITIYTLGIFLGLLHVLLGLLALSPLINLDYHRDLKSNFDSFAKSLTLLHPYVSRGSLALFLRLFVSIPQVTCGSLLLGNNRLGSIAKASNYGLIFIDSIVLLLQLNIGSSWERVAPTIVFVILLVTRLMIVESKRQVVVKGKTNLRPKTSTPKKNKNE